jgi:hypothetical protein
MHGPRALRALLARHGIVFLSRERGSRQFNRLLCHGASRLAVLERTRASWVFARWWTTPPRWWVRSRVSQSLRSSRTASGSPHRLAHTVEFEGGGLHPHRGSRVRQASRPALASAASQRAARYLAAPLGGRVCRYGEGGSAGRTLAQLCRGARRRRRAVLKDGLSSWLRFRASATVYSAGPEAKLRSEPVTGSSLSREPVGCSLRRESSDGARPSVRRGSPQPWFPIDPLAL